MVYLLTFNDGMGRTTEIGAFTNIDLLEEYTTNNPVSQYEYYEIKEILIIA
jgi:hypothetical protein